MYRFFVEEKSDNCFILSDKKMKHINVLRLKDKDFICIYESSFFICSLVPNTNKAIIKEKLSNNHEFNHKLFLAIGVIENKNFEFLLQKSVELGVTDFIPLLSENISKKFRYKENRWLEIIENASEQSFRNSKMKLWDPMNFDDAIKMNVKNKYICHEKSDKETINSFLNTDSIILVGPKGGFTDIEVEKAISNDFNVISLGKRILRAETAAIFALSNVRDK